MSAGSATHQAATKMLPLLALLLGISAAQAHAKLLSAEPAAQSTVPTPAKIQLHFSEELAKKFSTIKLADASGAIVPLTPANAADAKSLAVLPANVLTPGLYTVTWTAVASDDGHKSSGTFVFSVK
jgi:methionine-rich copper-binding protein CopC